MRRFVSALLVTVFLGMPLTAAAQTQPVLDPANDPQHPSTLCKLRYWAEKSSNPPQTAVDEANCERRAWQHYAIQYGPASSEMAAVQLLGMARLQIAAQIDAGKLNLAQAQDEFAKAIALIKTGSVKQYEDEQQVKAPPEAIASAAKAIIPDDPSQAWMILGQPMQ